MSKPGRKLTPSGNVDCAINASPVLISEDGKLDEWLLALIVKYKINVISLIYNLSGRAQ